jgi:D-alanyl-D-alanine carboxypeptidase (penicillin-binding protein 5/6)
MPRRVTVTAAVLAGAAFALAGATSAAAAGPPPGPRAAGRAPVIGGPQLAGRGIVVNYPARHRRLLPRVPCSAYVIADAGTGQVLAARDPHGEFLPASTLKVLTAVTLMPALDPARMVTVSRRAADAIPSKVGLLAGHRYRVSDLFKALLLISANDAAMALAQATGSYAKAVAMMNAEARHLRADDTVARRPSGLNGKGQHVSAYDEALFARAALAIPAFMRDERLRWAWFPLRPHHRPVRLWNQNTMLESYPGDLGGKIGWTTASKTTFVGWARRHYRTLIVTMLHCQPLTEMSFAAKLLNWGFAMDGRVRPVGWLVRPLAARPRHRPPARLRPAAQPAGAAFPALPLAAGLGSLAAATAAGLAGRRVTRRSRRRGSRPAP